MSYSTPPAVTAAQVLGSDGTSGKYDLNTYFVNNIAFLATAHGCRLYKSGSSPTISNNTGTTVTWDSEHSDSDGYHSTSGNTDRITIPTGLGGIYDFSGVVTWNESAAVGYRQVTLLRNGTIVAFAQVNPNSANTSHGWAFLNMSATAGDIFTIQVKQTSGGGLQFVLTNSYNMWVSASWRGL